MEKIILKEIKHVAKLAKLTLSDKEMHEMKVSISDILKHANSLEEIDVSNVKPLYHVLDIKATLREDKAIQGLTHEEALVNAPKADSDYFRVPHSID